MDLYQQAVAEFHKRMNIDHKDNWRPSDHTYGGQLIEISQELQDEITNEDGTTNVQALRDHLLIEELGEFLTAKTEEEALDGLTDLLYVLIGTAVAYDWPLEAALAEVHRSNMTKTQQSDDPHRTRLRKKGKNYEPPAIGKLLETYREGKFRIESRSSVGPMLDQLHNAFFKSRED